MLYQFSAFWFQRWNVDRLLPPIVTFGGLSIDRRYIRSVSFECCLSHDLLFLSKITLRGRSGHQSYVEITGRADIENFIQQNEIGTDYTEALGPMSILECGRFHVLEPFEFNEAECYLAETNVTHLIRRPLGRSRRVQMNTNIRARPEEVFEW